MAADQSVAIVGGGPIGLALALHLDMYGVASTVFNTEAETRWHPKGNIHNARTMELFRKLGIADKIRALGLPGDHPFDVAYFTRLNGYEIARGRTPSRDERLRMRQTGAATDQLPEPTHRVNQMYVERLLFDEASRRANITMRFGWTVEDVVENRDGVAIRARRSADGATEAWRSAYLVGCDGSRSTVRKALGIRYEGEDHLMNVFMGGEFVSIHMSIPGFYGVLGARRAWMYLTINPDTRIVIITLNGVDEFMMHKRRSAGETVDEAGIRMTIQRAIGADIPVQIVSQRAWHAGGYLVAEQFGRGRMLLAGDAAHLFTPTGGFGLNTGIDDIANLAWKLAAVVQGWGGDKLLATYEIERKPVAVRNTGVARDMGRAWHDLEVTSVIEQASPEGEAARRQAALSSFVVENHFVRPEDRDWLGVVLGARYDDSPIVVADGSRAGRRARTLHSLRPAGRPGAASMARPCSCRRKLALRPLGPLFHAAPHRRRSGRHYAPASRRASRGRAADGPRHSATADRGALPETPGVDPSRPAYRLAGRQLPQDRDALIARVVGR